MTGTLDPYGRIGAAGDRDGMYVRFDPGFGLNVTIGFRSRSPVGGRREDYDRLTLGIGGWEQLCDLADAYRERESTLPQCDHGIKSHLFCHLCPKDGG